MHPLMALQRENRKRRPTYHVVELGESFNSNGVEIPVGEPVRHAVPTDSRGRKLDLPTNRAEARNATRQYKAERKAEAGRTKKQRADRDRAFQAELRKKRLENLLPKTGELVKPADAAEVVKAAKKRIWTPRTKDAA